MIQKIIGKWNKFQKLCKERKYYRNLHGWLLNAYYQTLFTHRTLPLPQHTYPIKVYLRGIKYPFLLRPRSSDWHVLSSIFIHGEYDFIHNYDVGRVKT